MVSQNSSQSSVAATAERAGWEGGLTAREAGAAFGGSGRGAFFAGTAAGTGMGADGARTGGVDSTSKRATSSLDC
jgi:hypothetical protein